MDSSPALPAAAAAFGIAFDRRGYHYQQCSYDQLAAALDYAKREPGLSPAGPQVTKEVGEP